MTIEQYISNINQRYIQGNATEHTYRADLQNLIESIVPDIRATNEPKRQSCGAPDYIITKIDKSEKNSGVPIGYIEAKDIGDKDLLGEKKTGNKEQFDRYRTSLANLIFTDYIEFHFIQNEKLIKSIRIAEIVNGKIKPLPENFADFELYIKNFCSYISQTITQSSELVGLMAKKTRLFANAIQSALIQDIENAENSELYGHYQAFRQTLIEDITPVQFADIYAQTVTYGFFAARYRDYTLQDFSREEASRLIPSSNPFLKKLFQFISQIDLDKRILWIVEDLVSIFLATNLRDILHRYGVKTKMEDPIIHFYEDFLREYDPKLRKARGVWYTPAPVVNFIVRAVDDILKSEFGLSQGLADTSKIKIKVPIQDSTKLIEKEVHKVQILDPATGTGTFLAEVIKQIHKKFEGQQGIWNHYVEQHLIPRLNGFELLMASYSMAHLQLEILLSELSQEVQSESKLRENTNRFNIFLTNSLEEAKNERPNLFMAQWLTEEAILADKVKRDTPVMCVIGNPPYSGISSNNGTWISDLIEDYKYVDGVHFNERKHWLNDDYVKFIRYGQHFIEKNGSGVLAFINPHGFLDNPTFRGMRWHLLKTFDKIYTIDLHGNSKKKETAPDGSADVNVFDIQQGVSINIFIKTGKKRPNELGKVFHYDLFGKRDLKYDFLSENTLKNIDFKELEYNVPNYFFVPKNDIGRSDYENGFKVNDLFTLNNTGIVTGIDKLSIFPTKTDLIGTVERILSMNNPFDEYKIKDTRRTSKEGRIEDLRNAYNKGIIPINYRPFDIQFTLPFEKNEFWINSPRVDVMQHFLKGENVGLVTARQCVGDWRFVFITSNINEFNLTGTAGRFGSGNTFPLYLYPDSTQTDVFASSERVPNLNTEIVNEIAEKLGLSFTNEKETTKNTFAPIDILDYIYAVLHSPSYREKYKEFLKIDFPRVPYPKDVDTFWKLVKLGGEIRQIHLLESPVVEKYITQYPIDGNNVVIKPKYDYGKVYINDTQYFDNVPEIAWNFYIGGYQPAQKWLKDRKDRTLEYEDIQHYQKIIVALTETDRLMKEVDKVGVE